jgi:hypothetical protein
MKRLWQATRDLAIALGPSPVLSRYGSTLRGETQQPDSELPTLLRELFARYGNLESQPLLLFLRLGSIPGTEKLATDPAGEQFRRDGTAVVATGIDLIEWLRSRMPRYPIRFKLPYTDPFSSRVSDQGFPDSNWPWLLDARRAGFQARPTIAPQIAPALEVDEWAIRDALGEVRTALLESPVWKRYVDAEAALEHEHEETLEELLEHYRNETRPEAISRVEPHLLMRRMQHRHAALRLVEAEAERRGGAVAEYYAAFRGVDRTLGELISLLGQLLFYGEPDVIAFRRASWRRDRDGCVEVSLATTGLWMRLNEVVTIEAEVSPLAGLVVIEGINFSAKRRGDEFVEDVRLVGSLLPESK